MRRGKSYQNSLKSIAIKQGYLIEATIFSWNSLPPLEERIAIRNTLRALSTIHVCRYICMYIRIYVCIFLPLSPIGWTPKGREPRWCSPQRSALGERRQAERQSISGTMSVLQLSLWLPPYESFTFTLHTLSI